MVGRFREELHRQDSVEAALARTVATAGRTVVVSGVTVAIALASLMLFPEVFLRSMGYGGVATVLVDMLAALTVLPGAAGGARAPGERAADPPVRRTGRGRRSGRRLVPARGQRDAPARHLRAVIVVLLLALGLPFLHVSLGRDRRPGAARRRRSPGRSPRRSTVTSLAMSAADRDRDQLPGPDRRPAGPGRPRPGSPLRERPGPRARRAGAQVTGLSGTVARVSLSYSPDPMSVAARTIVAKVRAVPPPAGAVAYTGGMTAQLVDELSSLGATLPWMALMVALATFVLLFLAFGSVVLPLKAIAMNVISLSATFGVVVWVFQYGHLSRWLDFTPTGTIDPTMPILMLAIIFGLSMDYEVFLLSRIRERYDVTGDNTAAVASGLQRTGGVITSAALLLVIVIGFFSASGITFIKLMGVGMIVALIVDATIVRVLLVPATMRLLGRANWWAPRPLRRLYARYGISEGGDDDGQRPSELTELAQV